MDKKLHSQIINLSRSVFEDKEFDKVVTLLKKRMFNNLRVFIGDKMEYLETIFILDRSNEVLKKQIELCDELENTILELYINQIEVV